MGLRVWLLATAIAVAKANTANLRFETNGQLTQCNFLGGTSHDALFGLPANVENDDEEDRTFAIKGGCLDTSTPDPVWLESSESTTDEFYCAANREGAAPVLGEWPDPSAAWTVTGTFTLRERVYWALDKEFREQEAGVPEARTPTIWMNDLVYREREIRRFGFWSNCILTLGGDALPPEMLITALDTSEDNEIYALITYRDAAFTGSYADGSTCQAVDALRDHFLVGPIDMTALEAADEGSLYEVECPVERVVPLDDTATSVDTVAALIAARAGLDADGGPPMGDEMSPPCVGEGSLGHGADAMGFLAKNGEMWFAINQIANTMDASGAPHNGTTCLYTYDLDTDAVALLGPVNTDAGEQLQCVGGLQFDCTENLYIGTMDGAIHFIRDNDVDDLGDQIITSLDADFLVWEVDQAEGVGKTVGNSLLALPLLLLISPPARLSLTPTCSHMNLHSLTCTHMFERLTYLSMAPVA
ncbi:unnamed protein product [Chrysoparadoxa australica]